MGEATKQQFEMVLNVQKCSEWQKELILESGTRNSPTFPDCLYELLNSFNWDDTELVLSEPFLFKVYLNQNACHVYL